MPVVWDMLTPVEEVMQTFDHLVRPGKVHTLVSQTCHLPPEPLILSKRDAIAVFAQTHALPLAVVGRSRYLPASGLVAFGPAPEEYAQLAVR
jgi:hypothetical protein